MRNKSPVKIIVLNDNHYIQAKTLANKLNQPVLSRIDRDNFCLVYGSNIELFSPLALNLSPLTINFTTGKNRHRILFDLNYQQNLAKAVGAGKKPKVLDATCGLGQDSLVLASLGCSVLMVERNLFLAEMLMAAIANARLIPQFSKIMDSLEFKVGAAEKIMPQLSECFSVIYLDPMFPKNLKKSKPNKNMQYFRQIIKVDDDGSKLFNSAQNLNPEKIVVKRSIKDGFLNGKPPTNQIIGKTTRYDIYV